MRPEFVEIHLPTFNLVTSIVQRQEPVHVQILIPQAAVKRLDQDMIRGFAWPRGVQGDALSACPLIQRH